LAVVPFVPAGAGPLAKGATHIDDLLKVITHGDEIAKGFKSFKANHFRENLLRLTGFSNEAMKGFEAHHVLPQALEKKFIDILGKEFKETFGREFTINDPIWGAWVKNGTHQSWSRKYNELWEAWLINNPRATINELMDYAEQLGKDPRFNFTVSWKE
jgi:hypothetical protein